MVSVIIRRTASFVYKGCRCLLIVMGLFGLFLTGLEAAPIDPNNILVSVENSVREFTATGTLVQIIPFNYDNRYYFPTENLNGIVVDQYGLIDAVNGSYNPYLTRYSPSSNTFTHKPYPGWSVGAGRTYGTIAAYKNFVFVNTLGSFLGKTGGIIRFDVFNNTALRFATGTNFIGLNVGLDGKLYALVTTDASANEIRVFDPNTTALISQMPVPASIFSNDYIYCIAADQNGEIFLAGSRGTVYRVNGNLGIVETSKDTGFNGITNIQVDEKGRLVLGQTKRVILGDSLLLSNFTSFLAIDDPNGVWTTLACVAHAVPLPTGPVPTPTPTPVPTPTPTPIHNILVSIGMPTAGTDFQYNSVREFGPDGSFLRTITFNYNGGAYPSTEFLRDIVVDQNGIVDAFNGTFSPLLTRYSPSSNTFTHTTFPGWNIWNYTDFGGIAAYQNFIYVTDMDTAYQTNLNGIIRFDTAANTAARFFAGTDFINLNMGLDGKLYALFPGCGLWRNCSYASDINVYDPATMALLGHIAIPSDILASDGIQALAADQSGRIFICGSNGVVYRLSSSGTLETAEATGFNYTTNLKIDETGRIIVGQANGYVVVGDTTLNNDFGFFQAINDPRGSFWTLFVAFTPPLPRGPPLQLLSVASRKTHGSAGTFDINLPLQGQPGIECRSGGTYAGHSMVFTFTNPVINVGSVNISSGNAQLYATWLGSDTHEYWVDLSGVANAQTITVTLNNVTDSAGSVISNVSRSMGVLLGDVNANGIVSNTDVAEVKAQVTAPVDSSNFRDDVNANGIISNTDVALTKAQVGTTLPKLTAALTQGMYLYRWMCFWGDVDGSGR
jgi:hypothetical protein